MAQPLSGLLVLDFSRVLAGPHCGRVLADLGADVIKIEPPAGDLTRFGRPRVNSLATYFVQQNAGKRNISLDLDQPEAADLLVKLAARADVVIENFRPGVMDRMGLGYERLAAENPRLVFASITGYGQRGPWSHRGAYAPTIHAEMGMLDILARVRGEAPTGHAFSHADLYAGLQCAIAIMTALYHRERTGKGQRIDVSLAESLLFMNEHAHAEIAGDTGLVLRSTLVRSPVLPTRSGRYVLIAGDPCARGFFEALCRVMERPDLSSDSRFATTESRVENYPELLEVLRAWTESFEDPEELEALLDKARIAIGVVRSVEEAAGSEWAEHRGAVAEVSDRGGGMIKIPNHPWRFSETPGKVGELTAYRGEHNREVMREVLGLSDEEINRLESSGVLTSRPPRASQADES